MEFHDTAVAAGNACAAGEDISPAATGRAGKVWTVTLDLAVLQHIQAGPIPAEAPAGLEVADDHDGMMNAPDTGHDTSKEGHA